MLGWIRKGLTTGIVTTRYPARAESMPPNFRGIPKLDASRCAVETGCAACVAICPTKALRVENVGGTNRARQVVLDYARCIMCGLCAPACPTGALTLSSEFELAVQQRADLQVIVTER
jgi:hydrogenase-4 component H